MRATLLVISLAATTAASSASAVSSKSRFTVPDETVKKKKSDIDRGTKALPPKFVAEKYGKRFGDVMDKETAMKIDAEAQELNERPLHFFEVGDGGVKLLPEVMSVLDPENINKPFAPPGGAEEMELRNSRWWGRLYIDGWPQTIQFLRAHFGAPPPLGTRRIVLADPPDACGPLVEPTNSANPNSNSSSGYYAGAIVVAARGTCTFAHKALSALASAPDMAALVLVNNEPGNEHLTGPDAHDVALSVSMVAQADGELLLSVLRRDKASAGDSGGGGGNDSGGNGSGGHAMTGAMVPIHCHQKGSADSELAASLGDSLCGPVTAQERAAAISSPLEGGWLDVVTTTTATPATTTATKEKEAASSSLNVTGSSPAQADDRAAAPQRFEYLMATFGTKVDTARPVQVAALPAGAANACEPLIQAPTMEEKQEGEVKSDAPYAGKAVLVQRGGCNFYTKAKNSVNAGAAAVIVVNSETHLQRFGVEPRWRGLEIDVPVVMVTDIAGEELTRAAEEHSALRFTLSGSVREAVWTEEVAPWRAAAAAGGDESGKHWSARGGVSRKNQSPDEKKREKEGGKRWAAAEAGGDDSDAQLLKEVLASEIVAGWPERAAAVQQGYDAVHPPQAVQVAVNPEAVVAAA